MNFHVKSWLPTGVLLLAVGIQNTSYASPSDDSIHIAKPSPVFKGERVEFQQNGRRGLMDTLGNIVLQAAYDRIYWTPISDSMAIIQTDPFSGFVNWRTGEVVVPPKYKSASHFREGVAAVTEDYSKWGYINPDGSWAIAPQWDMALDFQQGIAQVFHVREEKDRGRLQMLAGSGCPPPGKTGYIDHSGAYVIPMNYSYIDNYQYPDHLLRFSRGEYHCDEPNGFCENPYPDSKWGLMDHQGRIVLPDDRYDYIVRYVYQAKSYYIVVQDGRSGLIDSSLSFILPLGSITNYEDLAEKIAAAVK